jgi:phosphate transport system protein
LRRDPALAERVLRQEQVVDREEGRLIREVLVFLDRHGRTGSQSVDYILIAKNMERVADLATNIAQEIIFVVDAEDVRHRDKLERLADRGA